MPDYPFLQQQFLDALEDSGSVCQRTGWTPRHLRVFRDGGEIAFMPLYLKSHSWGEYVFDWAWADAYRRHGLNYYPKLVSAIPFTPATGPRIRFAPGADRESATARLIGQGLELARETGASSWHVLFPGEDQLALLDTLGEEHGFMRRTGVQYHWFNRGYNTFDDFLGELVSRKRKMIRRERRQVIEQGLDIRMLTGGEIDPEIWDFFYGLYQRTYLKRSGSAGYLTRNFFHALAEVLPDQVAMAVARRDGAPVAAALYFFDDQTLYGRYWGCTQEYEFLHFELCYYCGIDFAISRRMAMFDAGAQGEHKILRGFEPVTTHSLHWIAEPAFAEAVRQFLRDEEIQMERYRIEAAQLLPYKITDQ